VPRRVRMQNRQRRLKVDRASLCRLLARVLDDEGVDRARMLEVALLRDARVAELNARYRGRCGPTDVLAFPVDARGWPREEPRPLGEVVVSVDRACAQAAERRIAAGDELARLLVHGLLHLLGYRDGAANERARMRRRENRHLRAGRGRGDRGRRTRAE